SQGIQAILSGGERKSDDGDEVKPNKLKAKIHVTKAEPLSAITRLVVERQCKWKRYEEPFQSTLCLIEFMTKA
ncbi:hypothetical protein BGX31_006845, partial [Mortierella sp. GBA43]